MTPAHGMVHEARGQFREAADRYRKVVEFTRANPEHYDARFVDNFLDLIVKLDASVAEAERAVNDVDRSMLTTTHRPAGPHPACIASGPATHGSSLHAT